MCSQGPKKGARGGGGSCMFVSLLACLLLYKVLSITMCVMSMCIMWLGCLYLLYLGWVGENYRQMVVFEYLFVEHEYGEMFEGYQVDLLHECMDGH